MMTDRNTVGMTHFLLYPLVLTSTRSPTGLFSPSFSFSLRLPAELGFSSTLLLPLPPRPLLSLVLSPRSRSRDDILDVETRLCLPESRSFLCDHSHYFCPFGLKENLVIHFIYSSVIAKVLLARLHFRYYSRCFIEACI